MSGNILKSVSWQWKMTAVWRPNRWSATRPFQAQWAPISAWHSLCGSKRQTKGSCYLPPCFYFLLQAETKRLSGVSVNATFCCLCDIRSLSGWKYSRSQFQGFSWKGKSCPSPVPLLNWVTGLFGNLLVGGWGGDIFKAAKQRWEERNQKETLSWSQIVLGGGWEGEFCFFWENISTAKTNKDGCSRSCYLWSPLALCQFPDYFYELFNPGLLFPL